MVNLGPDYSEPATPGPAIRAGKAPGDLQSVPRVVKIWPGLARSIQDTTDKLINSLRRDLAEKGVAGIDC